MLKLPRIHLPKQGILTCIPMETAVKLASVAPAGQAAATRAGSEEFYYKSGFTS